MIPVPCKDCEKKGCGAYHDQCELYQAFKAEKQKYYEYTRREGMKYTVKVRRRKREL